MNVDDLKQNIQNNITFQLNRHPDISMKTLSENIDSSDSYVQKLMTGKFLPSLNKLLEISNYFGVPLSALVSSKDEPPQEIQLLAKKLELLSPESLQHVAEQVDFLIKIEQKNE